MQIHNVCAVKYIQNRCGQTTGYSIGGKFGEGKVWQIDSFQTFGKRKPGELIDQPIDY